MVVAVAPAAAVAAAVMRVVVWQGAGWVVRWVCFLAGCGLAFLTLFWYLVKSSRAGKHDIEVADGADVPTANVLVEGARPPKQTRHLRNR